MHYIEYKKSFTLLRIVRISGLHASRMQSDDKTKNGALVYLMNRITSINLFLAKTQHHLPSFLHSIY